MHTYPFVYFGHGSARAAEGLEVFLWFHDPITPAQRTAIEATVPTALSQSTQWGSHALRVGSDDIYQVRVKAELTGESVDAITDRLKDFVEREEELLTPYSSV